MSSDDDPTEGETGDMLAKRARELVSGSTDAEQRAATTYALLAIYHELRRNDLGAKIDALALEVRKIAVWQEQRFQTESARHQPRGQ